MKSRAVSGKLITAQLIRKLFFYMETPKNLPFLLDMGFGVPPELAKTTNIYIILLQDKINIIFPSKASYSTFRRRLLSPSSVYKS